VSRIYKRYGWTRWGGGRVTLVSDSVEGNGYRDIIGQRAIVVNGGREILGELPVVIDNKLDVVGAR
jgi:hypothetical protein